MAGTVNQRRLAEIPAAYWLVLALALTAQVMVQWSRPPVARTIAELPEPPSVRLVRVLTLDEPAAAARLAMLWLQAFDYQPGISVPFTALDYARVESWLSLSLALDPALQYPLLVASRIYAEVNDPPRQRRMLEFVARAYRADPATRWRWLAHAVFVARHRLHDDDLALALAAELAAADPAQVPAWARQMHIFVLENIGELEAAKVLLAALLNSGQVSDDHERRFLARRLAALEARLREPGLSNP